MFWYCEQVGIGFVFDYVKICFVCDLVECDYLCVVGCGYVVICDDYQVCWLVQCGQVVDQYVDVCIYVGYCLCYVDVVGVVCVVCVVDGIEIQCYQFWLDYCWLLYLVQYCVDVLCVGYLLVELLLVFGLCVVFDCVVVVGFQCVIDCDVGVGLEYCCVVDVGFFCIDLDWCVFVLLEWIVGCYCEGFVGVCWVFYFVVDDFVVIGVQVGDECLVIGEGDVWEGWLYCCLYVVCCQL